MKPLVSIIIPCHNLADYVDEAITSALAQSYKPIEVIVVDDGSTDNSAARIKGFGAKVTYIKQRQAGAGAARNAGFRAAKGTYVTFLDADDRLDPTFVAASLKALRHHASSYTYTRMLRFGDYEEATETFAFDPSRLAVIGNYIGIGILIAKADFERAGGFDTNLPAYEDWDLWLRLLEKGITGTLVDEDLYFWRSRSRSRNTFDGPTLRRYSRMIKRRHWRAYIRYWLPAKVAKLRAIWRGELLPLRLLPPKKELMLTVVVPNWNGRDVIGDCLASLRQQTLKEMEVVVVENGSTDGSVTYLRRHFPEVRILVLPENLGFAGGVNVGIKAARGTFIALLNNDAIADEHWAAEMVAALAHADIVQAKILQLDDPTKIDSVGDAMSKWGLPYPTARDQIDTGDYQQPVEIFSACGGAAGYRRGVFETVGLFDEAFFAYIEDFDLSFRARLAGLKVMLVPTAKVFHHIGATSSRISNFGRFHYLRNSNYLFYQNLPMSILIPMLPRFGFSQLLLSLSAVANGAGGVVVAAYLQLFRHIPRLLVNRRRALARRTISNQELKGWFTDFWIFRFQIINRWRQRFSRDIG